MQIAGVETIHWCSSPAKYGSFIRGGSRIFFRRGCTLLLLYFNTNKPHSFFCRIPVVLENRRSSCGGGAHPLHPPPRSAPVYCSLRIFALNFWLQWWPVNGNFKALLLQPDLVSNGESPNIIQAGIRLSLEDFTINIGNGDQTTPTRAQKWLFLFSFLQ